jgi:two-component system, NtrC family, sensor kinase
VKILVLDDEKQVMRSLMRFLSRRGFEVEGFVTVQEALDRLPELRPDVVLSDYRMPGMNGLEFLERVEQVVPNAGRFLLTGYGNLSGSLPRPGFCTVLQKPWEPEVLVRLILDHPEQVAAGV